MRSIYIIIPCYNEEADITNLLCEIEKISKDYKPVVVNDCSTDNTYNVAKSYSNAIVIDLPINLGVGGAVQTGLKYADNVLADYAIKVDGDGQHNPSDIQNLLKPLFNNEADIVIGSRFLEESSGFKSTLFRRLGIRVLQFVCKLLTGKTITDPTSGFRAYNSKAIRFMSENYPSFDYPEPEELILATKNNLRISEIPVIMRNRQHGKSSISFYGSFYYMVKVILSMLFIKIR